MLDDEVRSSHIFSVFVQDEVTLVPDRLTMTLGSKLERNSYTGFEHQPSGRLVWTPNENHTIWAAVSRAVRTPSRFEISAKYQMTDWWRVSVGYSYLEIELHMDSSSNDGTAEDVEGGSSHHQFKMQSFVNLPYNLEFDTMVYYVENLPQDDVSGYIRLDTRLGWHLNKNLDVSIGLQNLLDPEHHEFHSSDGVEATEIERSIFGQITWRH